MSGACAVAADGRLAAYDFGPAHPFQAGRLEAGLGLLRAAGVLEDADLLAFGPAADADLELVHDRDYLEALARFSAPDPVAEEAEAVRYGLVGDNRPFPGMDAAARLVAGATVAMVSGSGPTVFGLFDTPAAARAAAGSLPGAIAVEPLP